MLENFGLNFLDFDFGGKAKEVKTMIYGGGRNPGAILPPKRDFVIL